MGTLHLSDIFTQALAGYQQSHRMSVQQHQACRSILACRTGKLGHLTLSAIVLPTLRTMPYVNTT